MTAGISLEELLAWNDEAAGYWYEHLDINRSLLELPCDMGGARNAQEFLRHIWLVELRWSQRITGLPLTSKESAPHGPLDALFNLHRQAMEIFRNLLAAPDQFWHEPLGVEIPELAANLRTPTRRKAAVHMLLHSQRHYAQLATLVRRAGFPARFGGDLLFSPALR